MNGFRFFKSKSNLTISFQNPSKSNLTISFQNPSKSKSINLTVSKSKSCLNPKLYQLCSAEGNFATCKQRVSLLLRQSRHY